MQKFTGTTFIVLFLVLIHLQLASGVGFAPRVINPASSKYFGQPSPNLLSTNLQQGNTTLATSPSNTTSWVDTMGDFGNHIVKGFQNTLSRLNEAPPSEKQTFLINAIFQPGKNLTTGDIGDFLQVFSKLDQQSIKTIMDANDNFKNFRKQYENMDDFKKKKAVGGLLTLLNSEKDFGLNKAEVYGGNMMTYLGDVAGIFANQLPPIRRQQQQQIISVFRKVQQQRNNGDSPFYFTSILENLQTFVSNIQEFLNIFYHEKMKTDMTTQKQQLMKQRLKLNNQRRSLEKQGLGNFIGKNATELRNNIQQYFNNINVTNIYNMAEEFPVGGPDYNPYKALLNEPIQTNQTPSLNQTNFKHLQKYYRTNEQLKKRNKAYLEQHAQTNFIKERGDSPVLKDLREHVTEIERLARNVAGKTDPRDVMKIIFNKKYERVIGYLAGLCNAIGEYGTGIQNMFLLQKNIDFGDKGNLDKFFKIMDLAYNNRLYGDHQPIFFNTLPAGGFINVFQKILEKFNVSEATRNKLNDDIIKFATDLEQKYNIILEDIRMMTVECYEVSTLKKSLIHLKELKEKLLLIGPDDITQEQGKQTVKQFEKKLKNVRAEHDTYMKEVQAEYETRMEKVYKYGERIVKELSDTIKLITDDKRLLQIKDSKEKTNISNAIQQMALTFFASLHSVTLAKTMFPPVAKFLNSSLNFIQNRVNEMFLPRGKQQGQLFLPGPDDTEVQITEVLQGDDAYGIVDQNGNQVQKQQQFKKKLKKRKQEFQDDMGLGPYV
jgi:hypothetical protein